jgi:uncharacterized protein
MGGFLRRVLLAFDRGDLTKVPFQRRHHGHSRLLMRRNVLLRVPLWRRSSPSITIPTSWWATTAVSPGSLTRTLLPHLSLLRARNLENQPVNYIRNSVKAVVDAYDGTVTFYVFDSPIPFWPRGAAFSRDLFKDASTMPAWLRAHVRYPETLLSLQAEVYGLYHMTDPEVFYNREDQWSVATKSVRARAATNPHSPCNPTLC